MNKRIKTQQALYAECQHNRRKTDRQDIGHESRLMHQKLSEPRLDPSADDHVPAYEPVGGS